MLEKVTSLFNYSFSLEAFISLSALILLLGALKKGDKGVINISWAAVFILFFSLILLSQTNIEEVVNPIFYFFKLNNFILVIKALIILSATIALILYIGHLNYNIKNCSFEYPIILLFAVVGMTVMVSANDFLTLYLGLELQSLAAYIMVAINRDNIKSSESGIKYFILGALSSGVFLFGVSLIYGFTGSIFFDDINILFSDKQINVLATYIGLLVGLVFVIVSLFFKVSAVPFHMWTPDVYQGAPTPVTLFIATVPKIAGFIALTRLLLEPFAAFTEDWQQIIAFAAILSLIVGALGALWQENFKRLLAYSSINHVGFMLLGILAANQAGIQALLLYLILYIIMVFGAFAFLMIIKQCHHSSDSDKKSMENISYYSGLSKTMPLTAIGIAFILLSMSGMPIFAGFFSKFFIFKAILAKGHYFIATIAAISAVIAMYYYLKIIKIMFFDESVETYDKSPTKPLKIIFGFSVIFNLLFFLSPNLLFDLTYFTANFFFVN